jgi:hypothetical protein
MKPYLPIIFLCFLALSGNSYAQDSTWREIKIDENLKLSFPDAITVTDTMVSKSGDPMKFKAYRSELGYSAFALVITPNETKMNVDNEESLRKVLKEMAKGSIKAMSNAGFTCNTIDTVIDNIKCEKLNCTNRFQTINSFIFLVNDKMYALQNSYITGFSQDTNLSNYFLKSIHFSKASIKEQQFFSKAESISYKVGYYLVPLLLFIGIIVLVIRKLTQ